MITITLLIVVVAVASTVSVEDCEDSHQHYKKAGCFKRNQELFTDLVITDLDKTHDKWGKVVDWADLQKSLHSLACRCERAAREEFSYFSIGFYGECWAGKNTNALKEKILNPGVHASNECIGGNYDKCNHESEQECAGPEDHEYVYEIIKESPDTKAPPTQPPTPAAITKEEGEKHLGKVFRFKSNNYQNRMMRHRDFELWIDESNVNADTYEKDSFFKIVPGLAGKGISFQAFNYPKRYLRHRGWLCYIEVNDGSELFKKDASFVPHLGFTAQKSVSFESVNYPGYYIRHASYRVRISKVVNTPLFKQDATWLPELAPLEYKFDTRSMSWSDSEKECVRWGGHLATIRSLTQNHFFASELKQRNMVSGWIGLNDRSREGSFKWIGADAYSGYTNWKVGEPNGGNGEDCAELIPGSKYWKGWNEKWNDRSCNSKYPFICERTKGTHPIYIEIDCFRDKGSRAISGGFVRYPANDAIKKCYEKAKANGNEYFAVQNNVECFTSKNAGLTYHKYGNTGGCSSTGRGGSYRNTVYRVLTDSLDYKEIDCFKDKGSRAISGGFVRFSSKDAIRKCYERAIAAGNEYFSVQNNVECFTSSNAGQTYNKYGYTDGCRNGRGGGYKNTVYRVLTGLPTTAVKTDSTSYVELGCYKDKSRRAISMAFVRYPANDAIRKCYDRAKAVGNEYFGVQNNVECFTSTNAGQTYHRYGPTDGCKNGRGGSWKNTVYRVLTGLYSSIGCYKDTITRTIQTLEGTDGRLDGSYKSRKDSIQKCYQVAKEKGFKYFAVQDGGWCASSATAGTTYHHLGTSTACREGKGGSWANNVYMINGH